MEIKKAVFVENNSADEGVSLSATPASEDAAEAAPPASTSNNKPVIEVVSEKDSLQDELGQDDDDIEETKAMLETNQPPQQPQLTSTASSSNHEHPFTEHRVNAVVSQPPKERHPSGRSSGREGHTTGQKLTQIHILQNSEWEWYIFSEPE